MDGRLVEQDVVLVEFILDCIWYGVQLCGYAERAIG